MTDTGAREQRLLDAIHAAVSFTYIKGEEARLRARVALKEAAGWPLSDGEPERLAELTSERLVALAAGVGVPPDEDLVSAPAEERQDARCLDELVVELTGVGEAPRVYKCELPLGHPGEWHQETVDGPPVRWTHTAREARSPNTAKNLAAGVGEARPADPDTLNLGRSAGDSSSNPARKGNSHPGRPASSDEEHQRQIWESRCPFCDVREIEELREQLDAADEAIASAMTSLATGPGKDGYAYAVLHEYIAARAALGVVGPPPNQTTDEVSALGQKASETRGGES